MLTAAQITPRATRIGLVPPPGITARTRAVARLYVHRDPGLRGHGAGLARTRRCAASPDAARHFGRREFPAAGSRRRHRPHRSARLRDLFDEAANAVEVVRRLSNYAEDDTVICTTSRPAGSSTAARSATSTSTAAGSPSPPSPHARPAAGPARRRLAAAHADVACRLRPAPTHPILVFMTPASAEHAHAGRGKGHQPPSLLRNRSPAALSRYTKPWWSSWTEGTSAAAAPQAATRRPGRRRLRHGLRR